MNTEKWNAECSIKPQLSVEYVFCLRKCKLFDCWICYEMCQMAYLIFLLKRIIFALQAYSMQKYDSGLLATMHVGQGQRQVLYGLSSTTINANFIFKPDHITTNPRLVMHANVSSCLARHINRTPNDKLAATLRSNLCMCQKTTQKHVTLHTCIFINLMHESNSN